jgi:outer membrane protein assembly factor BamB
MNPGPTGDAERVYVSFCETRRDIHHWVAGLDARTGRELWRTFVSAFPKPEAGMLQPSPLLAKDGKVFLATNMGTVAALDGATGELKWVFKYSIPASTSVPVWHANPLVCEKGVLVAAPREFPFLLALEPDTGHPLWSFWEFFDWDRFVHYINTRFRTGGERYDFRFRHLLGVSEGLLIYTSRTQVHARSLADGRLEWIHPEGADIVGRGCIAEGRVFVPTRKGVVVLDLLTGRRSRESTREFLLEWSDFEADRKPDATAWRDRTLPGGNLFVAKAKRRWCFRREGNRGPKCLGKYAYRKDGAAVCPKCGAVVENPQETFLVTVNNRGILCFAFRPAPEKKQEGGEGGK